MNDQLLNEWFDNLKYEDKCVAIYLCASDTFTPAELKKQFTPEEMLRDTYGKVWNNDELNRERFFNIPLEDKQFAYEKMNK